MSSSLALSLRILSNKGNVSPFTNYRQFVSLLAALDLKIFNIEDFGPRTFIGEGGETVVRVSLSPGTCHRSLHQSFQRGSHPQCRKQKSPHHLSCHPPRAAHLRTSDSQAPPKRSKCARRCFSGGGIWRCASVRGC